MPVLVVFVVLPVHQANVIQLPNHNMKKAFTLLEMLVVIGIIAILVALGTVSYSTAQKKARDAKRKGDLSAIQKVLEQCYSVNSFAYPTITNSSGTLTATCPAPNSSLTISVTDPLNNATYKYTAPTTDSSTYTIQAVLEINSGTFSVSQEQ